MSRLRQRLVANYAGHYRRVNASVHAGDLRPSKRSAMVRELGALVDSQAPEAEVLDLGCGAGLLVHWLVHHMHRPAVGVDASPTQLEIARANVPTAEFHCEDGLAFLRRNPGRFGGIFCFDVLEHLPGDDLLLEWLESAREALVPGGYFACRTPNAANFTAAYSLYMDLTHVRLFTSLTLRQVLEAAGFERTEVLPTAPHNLGARFRLGAEHALHAGVFRLCGRGKEAVFTKNVTVAARRPLA